jgi:dihydropteroate synthase
MTRIMGILNATPDSFFDKGAFFSVELALQHALRMAEEGADIIDIGGESSCPGAPDVAEMEEIRRVIPLVEALAPRFTVSIDTRKAKVAALAVEKGARLINDITGFSDPAMRELAASCDADLCLMHMQGTPATMQLKPTYPEGVVEHILSFFEKRIETLVQSGVKRERIILDRGIGFGKTVAHNFLLLRAIDRFRSYGLRVLYGASRKSFIQKTVLKPAEETLAATLAIHSYCIAKGVDIIRVHDVKEHRDAVTILQPFSVD